MTMAWEVTVDDLATVLEAHKLSYSGRRLELILDQLDVGAIERGVLYYVDMDNQIASAFCDIEDQLIGFGIVKGEKLFHDPKDDEDYYSEDDEDWGDNSDIFDEELGGEG